MPKFPLALHVSIASLVCFLTFTPVARCDSTAPPVAESKKPLPADFPELTHERRMSPSGMYGADEFTLLHFPNYRLLEQLRNYSHASIATEFGRRMDNEKDIHMKLLLAAIAADNGNSKAKEFIRNADGNCDYSVTRSRMNALDWLLLFSDEPQAWEFDAAREALADRRKTTGEHKGIVSFEPIEFKICEVAQKAGLGQTLEYFKNLDFDPSEIKLAWRTKEDQGLFVALIMTGHRYLIPVSYELLVHEDSVIRKGGTKMQTLSDEFVNVMVALKAKGVVPMLLYYVSSTRIMAALGMIGDERAIPLLKEIVSNHGIVKNDAEYRKRWLRPREFAARMALIKLEKDDPYPKWFEVLQDQSLKWNERREAVWELGNHPDARAVPHLIAAIKSDPDGHVVNQSITVLSVYKYKTAVSGLIDCFDADFNGKEDWKRANQPRMFSENIGETLHTLTGQNFGPDKAQWLKWWTETGSHLDSLK